MTKIKQKIIPFLCGALLATGLLYADFSEQEVIDTNFTPVIEKEANTKATSTVAYKFDIKTIKYFPKQIIENTIMIPTLIGTTTIDIATTTTEIIPAKYDYTTTTHTKEISKDEWNYCRATKTKKECEEEVARIVADSKTYHLEVAEAEMKALQDKLNRTDYFDELSIKEIIK